MKFISSGPLRKENTYQSVKSIVSDAPFPSRRLLGAKRTTVIEDRELKLRAFLSSLEKSLFPILYADSRPHVAPLRKIVGEFLMFKEEHLRALEPTTVVADDDASSAAAA